MIHIATVHWGSDRWIDIQLAYLARNIREPYRVYAWLDEELKGHSNKFFYATDVPLRQHELKLTLLGDLAAYAAIHRFVPPRPSSGASCRGTGAGAIDGGPRRGTR